MPALSGEVISTIRDGNGNTVIAMVFFFNPATLLLRDDVYVTVQDGTKTGCVIADNTTSRQLKVVLTNDINGNSRVITVPAHGRALTVAQATALGPPIFSNPPRLSDLNGFTFDLA